MRANDAQRNSSAYRLAALDADFIQSDSMRGVRFLLEFSKVEERLNAWGIRSTVVVFGSSRVLRGGSADPCDSTAPLHPGAIPCSGSHAARWYEQALRLGRIVSERGSALHPTAEGIRDHVIATGGGPGIMEAANRGAFEVGAPSIGFNIELQHGQEPNAFTTPDLTFRFQYFGMRKMHLVMRAAALVVFPGGFGTLDELFEMLTLAQTKKTPRIPVVCFDRSYWTRIINFDALAEEGMISRSDLQLVDFADDAEEAWQAIALQGVVAQGHQAISPHQAAAS
jgi:uncharacterized protein (TIGR00730 family)